MPLRMDSDMPSLEGGTDWFNSDGISRDSLLGSPVLVHFWSISCGTCKESLPDIASWIEKFGPKGLKVIAVHMPRQESDTNVPAVKESIDEYEIKQPCVVDNWHTITDAFENKFVPAYYLFDKNLKMRHFSAGEKAVKMVEPALERLINQEEASTTA
ncbi:MAG: redoxin domain-containing protein [Candidatus Obscuribacterales bacterium]|nr:redoxin domain-containing protein [Candidatus Obscuribacterales bacterium]